MNNRPGNSPAGNGVARRKESGAVALPDMGISSRVQAAFPATDPENSPGSPAHLTRKPVTRGNGKREFSLSRDALFTILRDNVHHIVSESYFYKTEPYYTILNHETEGRKVRPSSGAVLDAYIVPVCLERSRLAGIPVCEWGISQGYVPLPAIIYGLNYFATSSEYFVVHDTVHAKEAIGHITNKGKYPFCYQKIGEDAEIHSCPAIFGKTVDSCPGVAEIAEGIYRLFALPLVRMNMVKTGSGFALSSLSPMPYSKLSEGERSVLLAHLRHQEFL